MSVNDFNRSIIDEFRANEGRVGGRFQNGTLALITTTGARTGEPRTSPVAWLEIDGRPVIIASAAGAPKHPSWYHNLCADPSLTVELGTDEFPARAEIPGPQERADLWSKVTAMAPGFAEYQTKTTREIPVVLIHRTA